jgi:hypothetical protein
MRFTIHDEEDGTQPKDALLSPWIELLNRQTTPLAVPILWKTKTGPNWDEAH